MAGKAAVKRNWFIRLAGGIKTVNRVLEGKARDLAGVKGYVINLAACPDGRPVTAEFMIGACRRLFQTGKSSRMSRRDLQARPACHHRRDSIEAHLTIVFATPAVSGWIEEAAGWTTGKFVRTGTLPPDDRDRVGAHALTPQTFRPTTSKPSTSQQRSSAH